MYERELFRGFDIPRTCMNPRRNRRRRRERYFDIGIIDEVSGRRMKAVLFEFGREIWGDSEFSFNG